MGLRCGIDLGTTYSAISWYDDINNRVYTVDLNCADGKRVTPSAVYHPGQGQEPVVGEVAWNIKKGFPKQVATGIKRSMGNTDYRFRPSENEEYTPAEVSAEILKALIKDARTFLGEEVTEAVITVPAYFEDPQRNATREAGKMAGLEKVLLLPEPHAAALAYCIDKALDIIDQCLLVYDLGGGTFDVVLIHSTQSEDADNKVKPKIKTLYKAGNAQCGGIDWDRELANIVAEKVMQEHNVDVQQEARDEAILLENCERGKRILTQTSPAYIIADMAQHQVEVSRSEFEDRTSNLLFETQALLEQVLDESKEKDGIDKDRIQVMLTGGATKMPMVRRMIQDVTGKAPLEHGNPELLVTIGAAYWAHLTAGGEVTKMERTPDGDLTEKIVVSDDETITDKAHYAIGVEVIGTNEQGQTFRRNSVVIPFGSLYGDPSFEKEFYKSEDNMKEIRVILHKSDRDTDNIDECKPVAMFVIGPLPDGGKKGEPVKVKLGHDKEGILRGEAIDIVTGNKVDILVERDKLK